MTQLSRIEVSHNSPLLLHPTWNWGKLISSIPWTWDSQDLQKRKTSQDTIKTDFQSSELIIHALLGRRNCFGQEWCMTKIPGETFHILHCFCLYNILCCFCLYKIIALEHHLELELELKLKLSSNLVSSRQDKLNTEAPLRRPPNRTLTSGSHWSRIVWHLTWWWKFYKIASRVRNVPGLFFLERVAELKLQHGLWGHSNRNLRRHGPYSLQ